jgi:mannose-1-phosphate guanylyltransferase/phosphomannomutase
MRSRAFHVSHPQCERVSRAAPAAGVAGARSDSSTNVAGVVLAGVHQWGGSALDQACPRPLLPIANRPIITYSIDWLHKSGIRDLSVCANSHTRMIRKHLHGHPWHEMTIDYYEDTMPRGPAGCVKDAWLNSEIRTMVVMDGTSVPRCDLWDLMAAHEASEAVLTVVVASDQLPGRAHEEVLVPTGIYVFSKRALDYVGATGYQDIKEKLIPCLHAADQVVVAYRTELPVARVSGVDSYLAVSDWMLRRLLEHSQPPAEYRRMGEAWVHRSTKVGGSAELIGPILIGPGGVLGEGVTIVGPTSLGSRVVVGDRAVICRSSIWNRCSVGAQSLLDRCVLAHRMEVQPEASLRGKVCTETSDCSSLFRRLKL